MWLADRFAHVGLMRAETPDAARERLSDIFERAEFQRSKSLWQRFVEWLESLFGDSEPSVGAPPTGGAGALVNLVVWILIVALAVGVLLIVVQAIRRRVRRGKSAAPDAEILLADAERTVSEWEALAERYEAAGEWKEAMRCRYRELVARLVECRAVDPMPGRTTGELRVDMAASSAGVADAFGEASELFEQPWYADARTGAAQNARFRELAKVVVDGARPRVDELAQLVTAASGIGGSAESGGSTRAVEP